MNIAEELKLIIKSIATNVIDIESITDESNLQEDLGFDSVQVIGLIVEIESQYDVEFDDDDLDIQKLLVFGSLCQILTDKINN